MAPTLESIDAEIQKLRSEWETFRNDQYASLKQAVDELAKQIGEMRNAGYVTATDLASRLGTTGEQISAMEKRLSEARVVTAPATGDLPGNFGFVFEWMSRVLSKNFHGDMPDLQAYMNDPKRLVEVPGKITVIEPSAVAALDDAEYVFVNDGAAVVTEPAKVPQ